MSGGTYSFPIVILGGGFAGAYCARSLRAGSERTLSKRRPAGRPECHVVSSYAGRSERIVDIAAGCGESAAQFLPRHLYLYGSGRRYRPGAENGQFFTRPVYSSGIADVRAPGFGDWKRGRRQPGAGDVGTRLSDEDGGRRYSAQVDVLERLEAASVMTEEYSP